MKRGFIKFKKIEDAKTVSKLQQIKYLKGTIYIDSPGDSFNNFTSINSLNRMEESELAVNFGGNKLGSGSRLRSPNWIWRKSYGSFDSNQK